MVTNNGAKCSKLVLELAPTVGPRFNQALFEAQITEHVASYFGLLARGNLRLATSFGVCLSIQRRQTVRSSTDFVTLIMCLLTVEGVIKVLGPGLRLSGDRHGKCCLAFAPKHSRAVLGEKGTCR